MLMALVSSGFIARLDFGELARWGREKQGLGIRAQGLALRFRSGHF
jgi:hypothetical protein